MEKQKIIDRFMSGLLGLPDMPGVYIIIIAAHPKATQRVFYIGSSKNLKKRTNSHNHLFYKLYNRYPNFIVCRKYMICDNYNNTEIKYIKLLQPILNKIHNGKRTSIF